MGSLHLDSEEEPRRGASRANSVRFDESAMHGHFGHSSRSANDFPPSRTGSAFGSHPLAERSLSHKSDGRQSSTHSARASSIGLESRPLSATVSLFNTSALPSGTSPGLLILGPVPSIIRCWLDTNYSNDSLLYAAICTGSYKSMIHQRLLDKLGLSHHIQKHQDGHYVVRLPVYLAEATIQQPNSRSASPAPQLPTLTTEFLVQDTPLEVVSLDIFLGCDVLRVRNADIHFSLDRLTMLDDEQNKVSIPLARPENAVLFQGLRTTSFATSPGDGIFQEFTRRGVEGYEKVEEAKGLEHTGIARGSSQDEAIGKSSPMTPPVPSSATDDGKASINGLATINGKANVDRPTIDGKDGETATNGTTPDTPSRPEASAIWGSWRRDSNQGNREEPMLASAASASGYQRAGRGRGMKVLKPARLNTSRMPSSPQPVGFDAMPPRNGDGNKASSARYENTSPATGSERKSSAVEVKPPLSSKPSSSNPIGGASAFGWLNSVQKD